MPLPLTPSFRTSSQLSADPVPERRRRRSFPHRGFRLESLECRRLLAGDMMHEIDPLPPELLGGTVHGLKWDDVNQDGRRDDNEPGLAGVTVYSDLNFNGQLDSHEPSAVTQRDIPETDFDESGLYVLRRVPPGQQLIREVVPDGFVQTFPARVDFVADPKFFPADDAFAHVDPPFLEIPFGPGETFVEHVAITIEPYCIRPFEIDVVSSDPSVNLENMSGILINGCGGDVSQFEVAITMEQVPLSFDIQFVDVFSDSVLATLPVFSHPIPNANGGHLVRIISGGGVDGIDFGNARQRSGAIEGRKWLDRDGNGERDPGEPGLGGVTIYADLNRNGQLDRGDPRTITTFDHPETDFDEAGFYQLIGLDAGEHLVREVVPRNHVQTFPGMGATVIDSESGRMNDGVALDLDVTGVAASAGDDGSSIDVALELTVVWPDSCGVVIDSETSHTVVGDQIIVEIEGHQVGDVCAEAISPQSIQVGIDELQPGRYGVVAILHESIPEGPKDIPTLTAVASLTVGGPGAHRVTLEENQLVSGIDFGNRSRLEPGAIEGLKWDDTNGNGQRDRDEPGLPGVTIYLDTNFNGLWDPHERHTISMADDPDTDFDETGQYRIVDVEPGTYRVAEIVPRGFVQTFPATLRLFDLPPPDVIIFPPPFPGTGAHIVHVESGSTAAGIDFGNRRTPARGSVSGVKWSDDDGDGERDRNEPGLAGVVIYADLNRNRHHELHEPAARTQTDDPDTPQDETGRYELSGLRPGTYAIREVVPDGARQTFPSRGSDIVKIDRENLPHGSALSFDLIDVQSDPAADGIWGAVLTFEVVWPNGCHSLIDDATAVKANAQQVDVQLTGARVADLCFQAMVTQTVAVHVPNVAQGQYLVNAVLNEGEMKDGDRAEPSFLLHAKVDVFRSGGHVVDLPPGAHLSGIDFGNQHVGVPVNEIVLARADRDGNGHLDAHDIDLLAAAIREGDADPDDHDLSGDGRVDNLDLERLVTGLMQSLYGDANLDGVFDSSDLVKVFEAGEYEDDEVGNSGWEDGDWDGDGDFTSSDLVFALQYDGYSA